MIPMLLTISRFFFVPFIMEAIKTHQWKFVSGLFICAAITDFLDGFLARRWQQQTKWGSYLDPLADKVLMMSCYYSLWIAHILPSWFLIGIFIKELILLIAGVVYGSWYNVSMIPLWSGKSAMFMQALFVFGIFLMKSISVTFIIPLWFMTVIFIGALLPLIHYAFDIFWRII